MRMFLALTVRDESEHGDASTKEHDSNNTFGSSHKYAQRLSQIRTVPTFIINRHLRSSIPSVTQYQPQEPTNPSQQHTPNQHFSTSFQHYQPSKCAMNPASSSSAAAKSPNAPAHRPDPAPSVASPPNSVADTPARASCSAPTCSNLLI